MAQTFHPVTPVDCSISADATWTDVDLDDYVSGLGSDVTGVLLRCEADGFLQVGWRKNGSTDDRHGDSASALIYFAVGVDENHVFELYTETYASFTFWIVGYTTTGVTFLTNGVNKTPGSGGIWQDRDCTAETSANAVGLILEYYTTRTTSTGFGIRKNGSTDARNQDAYQRSGGIIGCDDSQIFEGYVDSSTNKIYLIGYIEDGVTFNTNATDVTPSSTGWLDLSSSLPSGAVMGLLEVECGNSGYSYGFRKNGESEDVRDVMYMHQHGISVECDSSGIIEGYASNVTQPNGIDFYIIGYAIAESGGSTYELSCTDGFKIGEPTIKGSLTIGLVCTDGLKSGDSPSKILELPLLGLDGFKAGDSPSNQLIINPDLTDGFKIGDTPSAQLSIQFALADGLKLGDNPSAGAAIYELSVTDGIKLSDVTNNNLLLQIALADGFKIGDEKGKLIFNGTNTYVNCGNSSSFDPITSKLTIEFDVTTSSTSWQTAIARGYLWDDNQWGVWYPDSQGGFRFIVRTAASQKTSNIIPITAGVKTRVIIVYDAGTITGYANGVANTAKTDLPATLPDLTGTIVTLGRDKSSYYLKGVEGEVRIYKRAITEAEVSEHTAGIYNDNTDLVGYWKLDEGSGTTATDSSGQGNTGTIYNGSWVKSPSLNISFSKSATDGFKLSDSTLANLSVILQAIDGMRASDTPSIGISYQISVQDGFKLSDAVSAGMQYLLAISDGFTLGDVVIVSKTRVVRITAKLYSRSLTIKMNSRNLTLNLNNRSLITNLHKRALDAQLFNRSLTMKLN